jgi:prolyl-tRNA synthetase
MSKNKRELKKEGKIDKNAISDIGLSHKKDVEEGSFFEHLTKKSQESGGKEKMANVKGITPRATNYSQWFLDIIKAAKLADNAPVKGCMVIRPNGFAIWENIQKILDSIFKELGVENAYFPLLIPLSFLQKEASHVEGFAKECAVVTHHRLETNREGKLVPAEAALLEEPLIIRPTSETIMYDMFRRWIGSYRDLPLLLNQWVNILRWEMRTRLFLRTTEFLWQEGHTAHATQEEANAETLQMLEVYRNFVENVLAIPVIAGKKSESEKFAGADFTSTIEAMMQDGRALQAATSHMLGQNFAKAFEVKFLDQSGVEQFVWQTSWGLSTRIIGALIMVHSDDIGLVLPPKIAPVQVVIVTIGKNDNEREATTKKANEIAIELRQRGVSVKVDSRDERPGAKFFKWEREGVPIRIEIGPKDLDKGTMNVVRRDTGEKETVAEVDLASRVSELLESIQQNLFDRAIAFSKEHTHEVNSWEDFQDVIDKEGGFLMAHWCGSAKCEEKIKEATKATIRCIPFDQKHEKGKCVLCGGESDSRVVFAKAY